jgi:hypothetical protein
MTRAQFALAVGATEKWVHNAAAALGRGMAYTPATARLLAVARAVQAVTPVPLVVAQRLAATALALPVPESGSVAISATDGGSVTLDLRRALSTFAVRLGRAVEHVPRRPGRRRSLRSQRSRDARGRAHTYGVDLSLIDSNLRRTPDERLRALDANATFVRALARRRAGSPRRRAGGA